MVGLNIIDVFQNEFSKIFFELTENKIYSNIIFLCIGTDRVAGDTYGPLVGHGLKQYFKNSINVDVVGDIENVVCATNVSYIMQKIETNYSNPFIIAVDASLSEDIKKVGNILVSSGGIYLGSSLGKRKIYVGNMNIRGVVAKNMGIPKYNFRMLQSVHLNNIIQMSNATVKGIISSIDYNYVL